MLNFVTKLLVRLPSGRPLARGCSLSEVAGRARLKPLADIPIGRHFFNVRGLMNIVRYGRAPYHCKKQINRKIATHWRLEKENPCSDVGRRSRIQDSKFISQGKTCYVRTTLVK
jgi:hypothetical protein